MDTIVAVVAPSDGSGVIGPVILIFIFLLLTAGLVLVIRLLLARLQSSRLPQGHRVGEDTRKVGAVVPGVETDGAAPPRLGEEGTRPALTGQTLKRRYLSGKISRAEYDEQLRRLQLEEFLEDGE